MSEWRRVSSALPCPICKKTDWCLVSQDGTTAICQRLESSRKAGEAGYIHSLDGNTAKEIAKLPPATREEKRTDLPELAKSYRFRAVPDARANHAKSLGVTPDSLKHMGVGWDGYAWTFPMEDACGGVIGIMRRYADGRKLSVKGGTLGLFVPHCLGKVSTLAICEGATDTAALISIGVHNVIGRPNCGAGSKLIREMIQRREIKKALIISDNDDVGVTGAKELASQICDLVRVKIVTPPAGIKDARAWVKAGCTKKTLAIMAMVSPEYKK